LQLRQDYNGANAKRYLSTCRVNELVRFLREEFVTTQAKNAEGSEFKVLSLYEKMSYEET